MLDHYVSFRACCEDNGVCPRCGDDIYTCRCPADEALELEVEAHAGGCACCWDDATDEAPVRVSGPVAYRPRVWVSRPIVESNLIDAGVL
jgi:hypothetical protein